MGSFDDKVVIITGGAGGIGRATAVEFAREGAAVAIADLDGAAASETAIQVQGAGGRGLVVESDVARSTDCQRVIAETVEAFGGVDIVFNNVGIQGPDQFFNVEEMPEKVWDQIIDVNLKSYFLMSKYAIPELRKRGGGVIVNTASVQGLQSEPGVPAYAASKGGVLSLTQQMALEYALENIRVVAVCPGSIDTPMNRAIAASMEPDQDPGETMRVWGRRHPIGRMGAPQDIANAVLFLASDKASFMTGEYVCVDGGYMAQGAWTTSGALQ